MSSGEATPSSSIRIPSLPMSALRREVANPGRSVMRTVSLPIAVPAASARAIVSSEVCNPQTSSQSFIFGTGLKKCIPTPRAGSSRQPMISVIDIAEVLVASTASGAAFASAVRNTSCLTSMRSTTASTTSRASRQPSATEVVVVTRRRAASAASGSTLPRSTPASRSRWIRATAPSSWPASRSTSRTSAPATADT